MGDRLVINKEHIVKYSKRKITQQKSKIQKFENSFLGIHKRSAMLKFQGSSPNGVISREDKPLKNKKGHNSVKNENFKNLKKCFFYHHKTNIFANFQPLTLNTVEARSYSN